MFPRPSFVTANFVARELGYRMDRGWMQGDRATNDAFAPLDTFEARFGAMLREIRDLGFAAVDLWCAHLHWRWATLEHVAIARRLLAAEGLAVRSYAAWIGGGETDLRSACRLCAALDAPVLAGHAEFFVQNRTGAVAIFREHGLRFAVENHPEKSAAELRLKLGDGDEDIVGVALDTGWCAAAGWDPLAATRELGRRLFAVHLKDVKARRPGKTGLELVDLGHETCALGDGVVPVAAVLAELRRAGFRGALGVEHEPEMVDPREDVRTSLARVVTWCTSPIVTETPPPLRVAVVGCGNIAGPYGEAMRRRPELRIVGACDVDPARAAAWTAAHGGRVYASLDEVLADPEVETVVNLTIQQAHVEVVERALAAGKHVHSEKPLAPTHAEAARLVALAAERGRRLSCAPVTWLGEAQQTAWRLVRTGQLGTPRVAYATVDWARIETWHPNPAPFYAVGPVADVGVYPLALLTAWFGPVRRVVAGGGLLLAERQTRDGRPFRPGSEDWVVAVLEFAGGLRARLTADFYVGDPAEQRAALEVHGDVGSVATEWFAATAPVRFGRFGETFRRVPLLRPALEFCDWSAGVYELWRALRADRPHPTGGAHAAHVVEIIEAVQRAVRTGGAVALTSDFPVPEPLEWAR